jgi:GH24 family phage-related lysozyme (muramidase)
VLQPKAVQAQLDVMIESSVKQSSEIHGRGKTMRQDTAAVTFNGENAAGVAPELMYQFRDTLVKHEGVRNTVYKDTKGNPTIGVGIANKAYFPKVGPDGKIDQATIDSTFRKASNDAATFGARATQQLGLSESKSAFLLFSEFAYQGTGGTFKEMAQAISRKDKEAALAALKTTKAYDYSQPARKAHYEKLVLASLEGK